MTGILLGALLVIAGASATAQGQEASCTKCHVSDFEPAIEHLERAMHGTLPGDDESCTSCHGDSKEHMKAPTKVAPDTSFGPRWPSTPDTRNASCLTCHTNGARLPWPGSAHQQENMACADCHQVHASQDPMLDTDLVLQRCTSCHSRIAAELHLPSRHPIAEGKTACTDCHNPHGSTGEASLHATSINDNCLSCHQEKRGPFLWEHQPVSEDCTLCHRPHGSVHDRLLVARGPALCQQCHSAAFHPSLPYGAEGLSGSNSSAYVLGKDCLNCHSQIHGSNHPSGARLTR